MSFTWGWGCCGCFPVLGVSLAWPLLCREMPLDDRDPVRQRGQRVDGKVSGTPQPEETGDTPAPDCSRMKVTAEGWEPGPALGDGDVTPGGAPLRQEEALMAELSELVQKVVRSSSWWERHGVDISILAGSFLLLPAGNSAQLPPQTAAKGVLAGPTASSWLLQCWSFVLEAY